MFPNKSGRDNSPSYRVKLPAACAGDRAHGVHDRFETGRGHRGAELRDAETRHFAHDAVDLLDREVRRAEFLPAVAVNLQIDHELTIAASSSEK